MILDDDMLCVDRLDKRFGKTTALEQVDFRLKKGEIVGLLGANGAGKTTLLRILSGVLPMSGGSVRMAGVDLGEDPLEARRHLGYMPENTPLYEDMRVSEYLRFRARLKGLRGRRLRRRVREAIESCVLTEMRERLIGRLSQGYRRRVAFADAWLHRPDILLLDEPIANLDPNQLRHMRALIDGLRGRSTVLLSSHILPEVASLCERVLILHEGRLVADGLPGALRGTSSAARVVVEIASGTKPDPAVFASIPGLKNIRVAPLPGEASPGWWRLLCESDGGRDLRPDLFERVKASGWPLRELHVVSSELEEIFTAYTAPLSPSFEAGAAKREGA